jgi:hypothetical protein
VDRPWREPDRDRRGECRITLSVDPQHPRERAGPFSTFTLKQTQNLADREVQPVSTARNLLLGSCGCLPRKAAAWSRTLARDKGDRPMKAVAEQLLGILLVLIGAAFVVAAFGGLGPIGIQSLPQQWVVGFGGILGGRILLVRTLRTRAAIGAVASGIDARIEEITNIPLHPIDGSGEGAAPFTASKL